MDISHTLEPTSEQLDAVELLGGPRIFAIERVSKGNAEQPVNVHLRDFPRPWRPGKSMRRVLVACWGPDASQYVGRRVELYCDTEVRFGGQAVGGTRISRISHIDGPKSVPLLVTRGKSAVYVVEPLPDAPVAHDWAAEIAAAGTVDELRAIWERSDKTNAISALIKARKAELSQPAPDPETGELPMDGPMSNEGGESE